MPTAKSKKVRTMSDDHKSALAAGRDQGRKVRHYLEALEANKPKRGRKRTAESIEARMATISAQIPGAQPLRRLELAQERVDLQRELAHLGEGVDLTQLEAEFVQVAKAYGERKGITYAVWREAGVSAAVLKRAKIGRS